MSAHTGVEDRMFHTLHELRELQSDCDFGRENGWGREHIDNTLEQIAEARVRLRDLCREFLSQHAQLELQQLELQQLEPHLPSLLAQPSLSPRGAPTTLPPIGSLSVAALMNSAG